MMTFSEIAIAGLVTGLVACAGLCQWSMVWGARHHVEDIFRND